MNTRQVDENEEHIANIANINVIPVVETKKRRKPLLKKGEAYKNVDLDELNALTADFMDFDIPKPMEPEFIDVPVKKAKQKLNSITIKPRAMPKCFDPLSSM
jgi:hypothetical protein